MAAELVAEGGAGSLTMEGLSVRAGVTKALAQHHFEDNADDVLVVLQSEVNNRIAVRSLDSLSAATDVSGRIQAVGQRPSST